MEAHWLIIFCATIATLFLTHYVLAITIMSITTDEEALLALKSHLAPLNPTSILATNWSTASPVCSWAGITCGSRHHRVTALNISNMQLTGTLPPHLGNLSFLTSLAARNNSFHGSLPAELSHLRRLRVLDLISNNLDGPFPEFLTVLPELVRLDLSINKLWGSLPDSISNMTALEILQLQQNNLQGNIPWDLSSLRNLEFLDLQANGFTGPIPSSIFNISTLQIIALTENRLSGELPGEMCRHLQNLERLLLSINSLSGEIPPSIGNCSRLQLVSLSYNNFTGRIPQEIGNLTVLKTFLIGDNFLGAAGKGGYGTVYKGMLRNGTEVAVKVFDTQLEGSTKSFDIECEALRNLRHRNLTKVITSCSNGDDFKSLVMEYMPNGNLEKWLYSGNYFLDMVRKLNIMIDVASALEYLHDGHAMPVAHCDLKPSNVLLDEDMVGHVCDFGIAKLLDAENSVARTKTLATIGYMAPEYGHEGLVSTKCDVYSFGIMLMETFTRVKPSDGMFVEEFSLRSWISELIPSSSIMNAIDANLLKEEDEEQHNNCNVERKIECILSIMELALQCTSTLPKERLDMKHVAEALKKIRMRL